MYFLKYLYESDDSKERCVRIGDNETRLFTPIGIDETHVMSIQANSFIDCKPKESLENLEEYTHMQIALADDKSNFLSVKSIHPAFASLAEIETYFDGQVYHNVPVDLIDELFHDLVLKKTAKERYYG